MIKGNWSLSAELKQNERKRQSKIQQRQKHQFKLDKLKQIDPIKLYHRIKRLEEQESRSIKDDEYLNNLQQDWEFIEKNKLHQLKIKTFFDNQQKLQQQKQKELNKLWGQKSIYFNPELNPLGKIPDINNLSERLEPLENLTIPLKNRKQITKYESDPLIQQLNIKLPSGDPPRFYKLIQNTSKPKPKVKIDEAEGDDEELQAKQLNESDASPVDSSDNEDEEEEDYNNHKKPKLV
ncbi:uncharacterized protein J8A68_005988 [[Candida] subhashii]|uniref:Uncharacterized protein n=1 Tax=[Candida] subhashii TaxID=561895 RepID=A0A8J5Q1A2_9ASCO|nr:uncharacterized protein J8A68_005988 [[Candida] subhashii]KAG7660569.1 hypothetical protein J8A68_005988 [[Candida] subhashii]